MLVVDTSIWIDLIRPGIAAEIKRAAFEIVTSEPAHICEPIEFELRRFAVGSDLTLIDELLDNVVSLPTPESIWNDAAKLGQRCRQNGVTSGAFDLLIAQVCIAHGAKLASYDSGFSDISRCTTLEVLSVKRPTVKT